MNEPIEKQEETTSSSALAATLAELGRYFYSRGWVLGTSGNFSAVIQREPLRLAITASGVDKGALTAEQILQIDAEARVVAGAGRPSDEARLHTAVVKTRGAQAVLHTHSVWSTILSEAHASAGGVSISGYEMLKGLAGVRTHEHREILPIVENSQDYIALSHVVDNVLRENPNCHGIYLRRHGLYTWGEDVTEARRHIEIFEFLFEVLGTSLKI